MLSMCYSSVECCFCLRERNSKEFEIRDTYHFPSWQKKEPCILFSKARRLEFPSTSYALFKKCITPACAEASAEAFRNLNAYIYEPGLIITGTPEASPPHPTP